MKQVHIKKIAVVVAIASTLILAGCGKSEPPPNSQPPVIGGGGFVGGPNGVCLPLSNGASIGFSGSNVGFIQSSYGQGMLVAGAIPPSTSAPFSYYAGQTHGSVGLQPGGYPQYSGVGMSYYGTAVSDQGIPEASLNVSVTPLQAPPINSGCTGGYCGSSYYNGSSVPIPLGTANISGVLQILNLNSGYNTGYNTGYSGGYNGGYLPYNPYQPTPQPIAPPQPSGCVSGIAFALNFVGGNYIYMGNAYLYLNNTNHGIWFKF